MKTYGIAALTFLVGFGLAYLVLPRKAVMKEGAGKSAPGAASMGAADPATDPSPGSSGSTSAVDPIWVASRQCRSLLPVLRNIQAQATKLTAENKRLKAQLSDSKWHLKTGQGQPVAWPDAPPPRFAKKAVLKALADALAEVGVKGEITDVDCREYPCVFVGTLPADYGPGIFAKLMGSKALAPYKGDVGLSMMGKSRVKQPNGQLRDVSRVGVSFAPREPTDQLGNVKKRTRFRLNQLMEAAASGDGQP